MIVWLVLYASAAAAQDSAVWPPFRNVRFRDACGLAHQVLTTGKPTNRTTWALGLIPRCGPLAGQTVVERLRHTATRLPTGDSLELLIGVTWGLQDATLFKGALAAAQDPAATEHARVQALRILFAILEPAEYASYATFIGQSTEWSTTMDYGVYHGEPLPRDFLERLSAVTDRLAEDTTLAGPIRNAASAVAGTARACSRRGTCGQ